MPGGDRTGPRGMGPRTGRGAGYCAGSNEPGYASSARGVGFGRGGGRGRRNRYYATGMPGWMRFNQDAGPPYTEPGRDLETRSLKQQADTLQADLDRISQRLSALEKEPAGS